MPALRSKITQCISSAGSTGDLDSHLSLVKRSGLYIKSARIYSNLTLYTPSIVPPPVKSYKDKPSKATLPSPLNRAIRMSNPYYGQGQPNGYNPGIGRGKYEPDYSNNSYAPSPDMSNGSSAARRYDQEPRTRHDHRKARHYDSSDSGSSSEDDRPPHRSSKKGHPKDSSRSKSSNRLDKAKEHFSTSDRGVGAGMIGAVAGAVIAQETAQRNGKGSIGATIAGLVLGGLAGNALERGYDK
ncbi:MAG: hypothetical protein Q9161_003410 [Pseudevernia consocians]